MGLFCHRPAASAQQGTDPSTYARYPLARSPSGTSGDYFALPTGTNRSCVWAVLISNGVGTLAANLLVSPVSTVYIPGGRKNEPVSEVAGSVLSFMVVPTTLPVLSFTMR